MKRTETNHLIVKAYTSSTLDPYAHFLGLLTANLLIMGRRAK